MEEVLLTAGGVGQFPYLPLHLFRHDVEIRGELPDLIVTGHLYPFREFPGSHLLRRFGKALQGLGEPCADS